MSYWYKRLLVGAYMVLAAVTVLAIVHLVNGAVPLLVFVCIVVGQVTWYRRRRG